MGTVPFRQEAMQTEASGIAMWLAAIPAVSFVVIAAVLSQVEVAWIYDSPTLLFLLNTAFLALAPLFASCLAARAFIASRSNSVLLLGCGLLTISCASFLAGWVRSFPDGANDTVTVYNLCFMLAGVFHLTGSLMGTSTRAKRGVLPARPGAGLLAAYGMVIALVAAVVGGAVKDFFPVFFVQGEGPTLLRQLVLAVAVTLFSLSSFIYAHLFFRTKAPFLWWYFLALLLIAQGLAIVLFQKAMGTPINWAGRGFQYLGGAYFFVAVWECLKEAHSKGTSFEKLLPALVDVAELTTAEEALRKSEEKYRTMMDQAADAVFMHDETGRILDVNRKACHSLGYSREELLSRSIGDIDPEAIQTGKHELWNKVLAGEHFTFESRQIRQDGSAIPVEVTLGSVHMPVGPAVLGIVRDITERKRAEFELRESEERHRQISELIADYAYSCVKLAGGTFVIDWLVGAVEKITGYSIEEIRSHGCWRFFVHSPDMPIFEKYVIGLTPGDTSDCELRILRKDGSIRWIRVTSKATEDSRNRLSHRLFGSCEDITKRKLAEVLSQSRMSMLDFAATHSLEELLQHALDEVGRITDSPIGFYHFVEADQKTLSLQAWSTRTVKEFCTAQGKGLHYPIDDAGVWVDCVRQGQPVIHNDYLSLPHRKGLPEGHAAVTRELAVPIFRKNLVVAILGVGNKPRDYTLDDVEIATFLADVAWEITGRKLAEEAVRRTEQNFHRSLEESPLGVRIVTTEGETIYANPAILNIYGFDSIEELKITPAESRYTPESYAEFQTRRENRKQGGYDPSEYEISIVRKDGEVRHLRVLRKGILWDGEGQFQVIYQDITERKQAEQEREDLEMQLRQAQKMEAIGTLAGGIAHDFNNILGIIMGYTEIAELELSSDSPLRPSIAEVLKATHRGKDLVAQILTFSRKQEQERKPLRVIPIFKEALRLLRSTLPTTIEIRQVIDVSEGKDLVLGDPTQIEQILMNLTTNAAHAMRERGGILKVTLSSVEFDSSVVGKPKEIGAGKYLNLSLEDTGSGMDPAIMDRIFEPYFTTKGPGEGTGLGLAVVHGIVESHGGAITVSSEPEMGTAFHVYLPSLEFSETSRPETLVAISRGNETILLVDDEEALVTAVKTMLEHLGYKVAATTSSIDALDLFRRSPDHFDLVITDQTMPNMTGQDLAKEVMRIRPDVPIILCTGFSEKVSRDEVMGTGIQALLMKPSAIGDIANTVRKVLDRT